jgi:pimeloyl-ACP methyl ester carboxylesterase
MSFGFSRTFVFCIAATTVPASALAATTPSLTWAPCNRGFPGSECATAIVPLDYDHPHGATIELALARIPATDPANRIGSLFLNPGGPGSSGVNLVLFRLGGFLSTALGGRFDIVGFDPRGVGASSPMHCFEDFDELIAFLSVGPIFPYQFSQERPYFDHYRSLGDRCFGKNDPITGHMSTADVVRDLDLLRRAVGDSHLNYLGFSYGSFIGTTYANMFPNRIRAMVLDGVLDPRLYSTSLEIVSSRTVSAKAFVEFLRLCDEAGPDCALSGPEGAEARFDELVDTLRAGPIMLNGSEYRYDMLISDAASAMYSPEFWGFYADLFDQLSDAIAGDAAAAGLAATTRGTIEDQIRAAIPEYADYPNGFEAYYGNHCDDAPYPSTFAGFHAGGEFAEAGSIFGPIWWWSIAGCSDWPTSPDRYIGPWRTRTSEPVLVVGNYFDGATDYDGAVAVNHLLRNSRLLSYAGWGHTAFQRSECVTNYVIEYLLDGSLPAEDTVCPANPNPFLPSPARSAAETPVLGLPPLWPLTPRL